MTVKSNKGRKKNPELTAASAERRALETKINRQLPYKQQSAVRILNSQPDNDHDYTNDPGEVIFNKMAELKYTWDIDEAKWNK